MRIFGWVMFILICVFVQAVAILLIGPQLIAKIATFKYRTKSYIEKEKTKADKKKNKEPILLNPTSFGDKIKDMDLTIVENQLNTEGIENEIEETKTEEVEDELQPIV